MLMQKQAWKMDYVMSIDEAVANQSDAESREINSDSETNFAEVIESTPTTSKQHRNSKRASVKDRLDSMSDTLRAVQELLLKRGLTGNDAVGNSEQKDKTTKNKNKTSKSQGEKEIISTKNSTSETTINALEKLPVNEQLVDPEIMFKVLDEHPVNTSDNDGRGKRDSSSSEDKIDTSDEMLEVENEPLCQVNPDSFIAECEKEARMRSDKTKGEAILRANQAIREAEAAKIRMLATPGKQCYDAGEDCFQGGTAIQHSSIVDECYVSVGAHVDSNLSDKIKRGEYVDFVKLLPRDRLSAVQEDKLELVYKNGQMFFIPARDKDIIGITNFHCWEQAFRIFSNIYLKERPDRASELIQYNHIIFTALNMYVWDNVYNYDCEFRLHMGIFPERSWAVILQQAWSICLKDRFNGQFNSGNSGGSTKNKKEICQRFNKGLCTTGHACKYDHRCLGCGKFGHGVHICHNKKSQGSVANESNVVMSNVNSSNNNSNAQSS